MLHMPVVFSRDSHTALNLLSVCSLQTKLLITNSFFRPNQEECFCLSVFVMPACTTGLGSIHFNIHIKNKNAMTEEHAGMNSNNCF